MPRPQHLPSMIGDDLGGFPHPRMPLPSATKPNQAAACCTRLRTVGVKVGLVEGILHSVQRPQAKGEFKQRATTS